MLVLALAMSALAVPTSALASDPDGNPYMSNLAGRPICGYADGSVSGCDVPQYETTCSGIGYANLGGKMALITAGHCQPRVNSSDVRCTINTLGDNLQSGASAATYGPTTSVIGYWGTDYGLDLDGSCEHDVGVIWLYQGNWPAYRNRVIHGDPAAGEYWTITRPDTPLSWDCSLSMGRYGYQSYEYHIGDGTPARFGIATYGFYGGDSAGPCTFKTIEPLHAKPGQGANCTATVRTGCATDSGTPWILDGHLDAPWAVSSGPWTSGSYAYIYITPLYEGMNDLNSYFTSHYPYSGAHWCTSADCGGIGGQ